MRTAIMTMPDRLSDRPLELLRLLQLADSALPIGATSHSYGLETLAEETLTVEQLPRFLADYLRETGSQEAVYCRKAYRLAACDPQTFITQWLDLNRRMSALKPARESRAAGATLGRRLLQLVCDLENQPLLLHALQVAKQQKVDSQHCTAFGLIGGILGFAEETTVLAYLQQSLTGLVSACQRLMPLGQQCASRLLWELQPVLIEAAICSQNREPSEAACFTPLLDLAAMRHPDLTTRLFVS